MITDIFAAGDAFAAAADAAFEQTLSPAFSPYLNELFFYHGSFIFEDVGECSLQLAANHTLTVTALEPAYGLHSSGLCRISGLIQPDLRCMSSAQHFSIHEIRPSAEYVLIQHC